MDSPELNRRLTTVLAADVAEYTRLMSVDEAGTMAALREIRVALTDPAIATHRGRVVKLMGDGALVEFPSVVDAVECAVGIQRAMRFHAEGVPPDRRILFRIGINLGDAIVEGDDLYGDGVNVAFRLQGLAEPGGIVVSRTVRNEARDRLPYGFEGMGETMVKNHPRPLKPYRLLEDGPATAAPAPAVARVLTPASEPTPNRAPPLRRAAAALIALAVLVSGVLLWRADGPAPAPAGTAPATVTPRIAVLSFADMGGDPAAAYLGEGFAEDVTTALSTFPGLRVVSRTSAFAVDPKRPVQEIGRDLGARYVLEGSVRKAGGNVRVTTQLIDAETGDHVWAETFDETGDDVLAMQAAVARKVADATAGITGDIYKAQERIAWAANPINLAEYDYYLRGHALFMNDRRDDDAEACAIWREGLGKFPNSALLRVKLGFCSVRNLNNGDGAGIPVEIETMTRLAAEANAIKGRSTLELWMGAWLDAYVALWREDWPAVQRAAQAAVALAPGEPTALGDLAQALAPAGFTREAIALADEALARDPGNRFAKYGVVWSHMLGGDPNRAIEVGATLGEPNIGVVAALVRAGRLDAARAENARLQKAWGGWTIAQEALFPMRADLEAAYLDDLRKAGMTE